MRIVGGRFGGRRLPAPRGGGTRPTADRVREGIASALEARGMIEGAVVLDLFAGTGALGLEAISRGAEQAVFVDSDPQRVREITEAARTLGIPERVRALALDLAKPPRQWLARLPEEAFDLVFLDPPYAQIALVTSVLAAARESGKLRSGGAIVVEHARRHPPELPPGFTEIASYRYGDTAVVLSTVDENG